MQIQHPSVSGASRISQLFPWLIPLLPGIEALQQSEPVVGIEFYSGLGGLSFSFELIGGKLVLCVNHDADAVASHRINFKSTQHLRASVEHLVMEDLPNGDVLLGGPECIYQTNARGLPLRQQRRLGRWTDLHHMTPAEQSRASMWQMYYALAAKPSLKGGFFENVVEAATLWSDYDEWVQAIRDLGYNYQDLYLNARHFGVPQSRDRYIGIATHKDLPVPDLDIRPPAYCDLCDLVSGSVQTWKPGRERGEYEAQYTYHCARCDREVIPFYRPAAVFIDFEDRGVPIKDRHRHGLKPLCANTLRRIEEGIERFFSRPQTVPPAVYGIPADFPPSECFPFWVKYNSNGKAYSIFDPICTVSSRDRCGMLFPPEGWSFSMGLPHLVDCGYRMLTKQEVQAAMCLEPLQVAKKSKAVRQCGLAVAPPHVLVPLWRFMQVLRPPVRTASLLRIEGME